MRTENLALAAAITSSVLSGISLYGCEKVAKVPKKIAIAAICTVEGNIYSHERDNCFTREGYDK